MRNNLSSFQNSICKGGDILDFLDDVKKTKALGKDNDFDIVDIVKNYYGISNPTMADNDKDVFNYQTNKQSTLSRMSTMAKTLEEDHQEQIRQKTNNYELEDWQYLFDERAGIYEFDSGYISKEYAEELAFKDVVELFIKQNQIDRNCQQAKDFTKQLSKITNQTIN